MRLKPSKTIAVAVLLITSIILYDIFPYTGAFKEAKAEKVSVSKEKGLEILYNSYGITKEDYARYILGAKADYDLEKAEARLNVTHTSKIHGYDGEAIGLLYDESAEYEVYVSKDGYYQIEVDHLVDGDVLSNLTIDVKINGVNPYAESETIDVPLIWEDESKEFTLDSYGDESLPNQRRISRWSRLNMFNNTYDTTSPLCFKLNKGKNIIKITNVSSGRIYLGNMHVMPPKKVPSYSDYLSSHRANSPNEYQFINAISYKEKNSSYIRMNAYQSPSVTPFSSVDKKINIIDGMGWQISGQEITYDIEVKEDGFYQLALHYMNDKEDFSVFRTIKIDGDIPFEEVKAYEFEYTKGKWANKVVSAEDSTPYKFYLSRGKHSISFKAENEKVASSIAELQFLINHINQFTLEIRKIVGKEVDKKRTWRLTKYIPETEKYLKAYENIIKGIIENLEVYAPNGKDSTTLSYLNKALAKLEKMQEEPDKLPLYYEQLYSGSGSVTQMLGDTIDRLNNEALYLDGFYIYNEAELKRPNAGIFSKLGASAESFISTFTSSKYVIREDKTALNIWVSRPITYIDIMQKMVDSKFTKDTGIKVKISVMPDANKLILANAANESPDIAIGLPSYMPYDFAIRGAAYDLTEFDDFWTTARRAAPGAFIPYILNDGVYAFPETLDFHSLIYRKDVFTSLGFKVPDTWQDVVELLPSLQRYGMNFYHPIAGGGALKWFYQTCPFIYQNGGKLFTDDGTAASINTPEAVNGISFLSQLFTIYSLPEQVPSFYNSFRYNILPIGIVDFNTYLQLKNAAPELKGQWELARYPGTKREDGKISRYYIANGTNTMILKSAKRPKKGWEFIKWWTSTDIQTEYAYRLQSTYGPQFVWLSGNIEAVKNAPIDEVDKRVILEQIKWINDVPRTPGQYMLERGISDIWSKATQDGVVPRVAIDQQTIEINREIKKKLIEFGYVDEEGRKLKPYVIRDIDWVVEQMEKGGVK